MMKVSQQTLQTTDCSEERIVLSETASGRLILSVVAESDSECTLSEGGKMNSEFFGLAVNAQFQFFSE